MLVNVLGFQSKRAETRTSFPIPSQETQLIDTSSSSILSQAAELDVSSDSHEVVLKFLCRRRIFGCLDILRTRHIL
jgi:hypothetical protein